jgi:hypothetical protein
MRNVQFDIGRKLAGMAVGAQIVGARYFHPAHGSENPLGAQFPVVSWAAASTEHRALIGRRGWKSHELGQGGGSSLMHRRPHRHFDGFQIEVPGFAAPGEDGTQQLLYLARDFLADRFGRFFSCGEKVSSTGRARQIFSLTSSNS